MTGRWVFVLPAAGLAGLVAVGVISPLFMALVATTAPAWTPASEPGSGAFWFVASLITGVPFGFASAYVAAKVAPVARLWVPAAQAIPWVVLGYLIAADDMFGGAWPWFLPLAVLLGSAAAIAALRYKLRYRWARWYAELRGR